LISNENYLLYYQNEGAPGQPAYNLITEDYLDFPAEDIVLYDLDADGDPDLISAQGALFNAQIKFYENIGTLQNPFFTYWFTIQTSYDYLQTATVADMDADGDGDLLFGAFGQGLVYYQNQGNPHIPNFILQTEHWQNLPGGRNPRFVDFDLDGDYDLLTGFNMLGLTELWENVGTPQQAQMVLADSNLVGTFYGIPAGADLDNDGDVDLVLGSSDGGIYFFRNVTPSGVHPNPKRPAPLERLITISPNPGNSSLVARYSLLQAGPVSLKVYDISGRLTGTLFYGFQLPGTYSFTWDASSKASGLYLLRLDTPQATATEKVVIMK